MLYEQCKRRYRRLYPPSLFENTYFVAIDLCSFWCPGDDTLFSWKGSPKLAPVFCGNKKKKGLKGCSVVLVLDHSEREK